MYLFTCSKTTRNLKKCIMKKSKLILVLAFLLSCFSLFAQNGRPKIKYGDVKPEDFAPTVYSVDSFANAVYLYDIGSSIYEGNNRGMFSVIFRKHARIRLMNKNGFDEATVEIHLY